MVDSFEAELNEAFEQGRQRGRAEGIAEGGTNRTEVQMAYLDKQIAEAQVQPLRLRIKELEEENEQLKRKLERNNEMG